MSDLDAFENEVNRWESQANDVLSDAIKIAVVQRGIRDEAARDHLVLHRPPR